MQTALPQQFVISPYSNTLPSSTLTTDAPSQQMTCPKMTPSTNPVPMPVIQPNRQVPDRHSNTNRLNWMKYLTGTQYNSTKPWSTWQALKYKSAKPWRTRQALKYKSVKPWSTWQAHNTNLPNHEIPDTITDTWHNSAKSWSTWQALNTNLPNHEVPDTITGTQYNSAKPWSTWQALSTKLQKLPSQNYRKFG